MKPLAPRNRTRVIDLAHFVLLISAVGALLFTARPYFTVGPISGKSHHDFSTGSAGIPLPAVGQRLEPLQYQSYLGAEFKIDEKSGYQVVVVVFLGTECPLANAYAAELRALSRQFIDRGVMFLGIDSNEQDSLADIAAFVQEHDLSFDIAKDLENRLADLFRATRTPEAFVLDRELTVRYHGRIDDRYYTDGIRRPQATREFVKDAIDALLSNKTISTPAVPLDGCLIGRKRAPNESHSITYHGQIAALLRSHCVPCHRPGQGAPFGLVSYSECAGWAPTIAEVVKQGRMPPWHADPDYGHFENARGLSAGEHEQLMSWVAAGAPEGKAGKTVPIDSSDGWRIRPDIVIPMAPTPFHVPATGVVDYQYFMVDPGFTKDQWVSAAQIQPGEPRAVHHIFVIAVPPVIADMNQVDTLPSEFLVAAVPGCEPMTLPRGMAKRIPAGSMLRFEVHYAPFGKPVEDVSRVTFQFADRAEVKKEVSTILVANTDFTIRPRDVDVEVIATTTIPNHSLLISLLPHAHLRGKSFVVSATYPTGKEEILLKVPKYHFNWQHTYRLLTPAPLPAGTVIRVEAHYDNSLANTANPNPDASVRWGPQQTDEMMLCYLEIASADNSEVASRHPRTDTFIQDLGNKDLHRLEPADMSRLLSEEAYFAKLCSQVMKCVPQLDGIALISVRNRTLDVPFTHFRSHFDNVERQLAGKRFNTLGLTLPDYVRNQECVVHQNIAQVAGIDFMILRQEFASTMYVAAENAEAPWGLCLLSTEPFAFPPEAVELIREFFTESGVSIMND